MIDDPPSVLAARRIIKEHDENAFSRPTALELQAQGGWEANAHESGDAKIMNDDEHRRMTDVYYADLRFFGVACRFSTP